MKLLIIADIGDFRWEHGEGQADVVLSCGDVADRVILEAARAHACRTIFAVKGNHDTNAAFADPIVDLHLQVREYRGLTFGGLNGAWRYKPRGHFLYDQDEVEDLLRTFPPVHVLLSHNSPQRIHERDDEAHVGFEALNSYIRRALPRLVIHGHQHADRETMLEDTRIVGVFGHKQMEICKTKASSMRCAAGHAGVAISADI